MLFAAFLGYNPVTHLIPPHVLAHLTPPQSAALSGRSFFPHLIADPFRSGLHEAFAFAIIACLIAAAASWSRGDRYVHSERPGAVRPGRPRSPRPSARAKLCDACSSMYVTIGPCTSRPSPGALPDQRGQELVGEPLPPDGDGAAGGDAVEVVVELLALGHRRPADEVRRPERHDPGDLLDERAPGLELADEELELDLPVAARDDAQRHNLRVRDVQDLAGDAAQGQRAQRDRFDDALHPQDVDRDVVADPEPALEEHQQAGDHVHQEALRGEADHDRDEGRADDRLQPLRTREDDDREQQRERERQVADRRLDQRDRRLALADARDHAGVEVSSAPPRRRSQRSTRNAATRTAIRPMIHASSEERDDDHDHRQRPPERHVVAEDVDRLFNGTSPCRSYATRAGPRPRRRPRARGPAPPTRSARTPCLRRPRTSPRSARARPRCPG